MALDWKSAYAEMHVQGEADFPPVGLHYLLQVCRETSRHADGGVLTPEALVKNFRQRVQRDFRSLANEVLRDWNLQSAEDLGKAVVLLGRHGCLILEPTDTVEAFAALETPL